MLCVRLLGPVNVCVIEKMYSVSKHLPAKANLSLTFFKRNTCTEQYFGDLGSVHIYIVFLIYKLIAAV